MRRRRRVAADHEYDDADPSHATGRFPTPEEALLERERLRIRQEMLTVARTHLARNAVALQVLDWSDRGVHDAAEQAANIGCSVKAAREELERIDALTAEELEREMEVAPVGRESVCALTETAVAQAADGFEKAPALAAGSRSRKVMLFGVRPDTKRRIPVGWIAVAACLAVTASAIATSYPQIAAWLNPSPVVPDPRTLPPTHEETPVEKAKKLRENAYAACGANKYDECARMLDGAQTLDPAGEQDLRVQALRGAIQQDRDDRTRRTETKPP
jgi:hypothetical protein